MQLYRSFLEKFNSASWILAILGLIFLGVGLGTLYMLGQTQQLDCQRGGEGIDCTITTTWMNRVPLRVSDIVRLQSASLEESCDEDGCTYRVLLTARRGNFALSDVYTSDQAEQQAIADQINNFVKDPERTELTLQTHAGWLIVVPIIFIGLGMFYAGTNLFGILRSSLAQLTA